MSYVPIALSYIFAVFFVPSLYFLFQRFSCSSLWFLLLLPPQICLHISNRAGLLFGYVLTIVPLLLRVHTLFAAQTSYTHVYTVNQQQDFSSVEAMFRVYFFWFFLGINWQTTFFKFLVEVFCKPQPTITLCLISSIGKTKWHQRSTKAKIVSCCIWEKELSLFPQRQLPNFFQCRRFCAQLLDWMISFYMHFSLCNSFHSSVGASPHEDSNLFLTYTWVIAHFQAGLELKRRATRRKIFIETLILPEKSQLPSCNQKEVSEFKSFWFIEDGFVEWIFEEDNLNQSSDPYFTPNLKVLLSLQISTQVHL